MIKIAILLILAIAIFLAINPKQKTNEKTDSYTKNNMGQFVDALNRYNSTNMSYPASISALDITILPTPFPGYSDFNYAVIPTNCKGTKASPCIDMTLSIKLKAPATYGNTIWCYRSSTGITLEGTTCPLP